MGTKIWTMQNYYKSFQMNGNIINVKMNAKKQNTRKWFQKLRLYQV